jgi:serine/threonine protein kinase
MDFCGFGSLYGVLHNRRQHITAAHVLRWMADTCRGMMYLHSRSIIHRDVKSGNLLLDDSGACRGFPKSNDCLTVTNPYSRLSKTD